ncbi:S8 family serine peptidase [Bradyrhizobium sp. 83012]|uniref:S8 family serine peptidase n=1 Tax=Bradyrhizobium aeschynomenes TaxID=2734909 RepID=A0ABX2CFP2_9BRAD|nr:S8 family serine peptidase [Bradyrhizobium aeschynomenes]NPU67023.1 S8 family serine peptidase [Bradyrhizobium aeschynomenes]NPV19869.1 S8 family serine peptidase [Bradyrhizobium aeschynomenes]
MSFSALLRSARRPAALSAAVALALVSGAISASAQAMMRSPTINMPSRVPTLNPGAAMRTPGPGSGIGLRPALPTARFSPNLQTSCSPPDRSASGECLRRPPQTADGGPDRETSNGGRSGKPKSVKAAQRRAPQATAAAGPNIIAGELVAELDGNLSPDQADALARRHGLQRISSQSFPLIGATVGLFRITDRSSIAAVSRRLAADRSVRSVQPNYRYTLQQSAPPAEGDPAQYALTKLRLPEAHRLAQGSNVTIAVIDSGVDLKHPEFADAAFDAFDALGGDEMPHVHGTGIAGVIVSHKRLMGSAPYARIIAIRAFGVAKKGGGPESSSYVILKALDYAALHGAQIVNMSFAGPKDAVIERAIAAVAAKDVVMIAAAGNAGAKSPPLYPAANPNVIAVSATDTRDQLLPASNRGNYVALAAPGADIFLPAPDGKYQIISGTSFSAAYVSGLAALVLERNPALKPETVRTVLTRTARDLGAPGQDELYGAGQADALAAVQAVASPQDGPTVSAAPAAGLPRDEEQHAAPVRELRPASAAAMATGDSPAEGGVRPAQQ